jgi:hypothetical protein
MLRRKKKKISFGKTETRELHETCREVLYKLDIKYNRVMVIVHCTVNNRRLFQFPHAVAFMNVPTHVYDRFPFQYNRFQHFIANFDTNLADRYSSAYKK